MSKNMPVEQRFWQKVQKTDTCWIWIGATHGPKGYGSFGYKGKPWKAHRASWDMHNGPIPPGMFVCHSCDNPRCVRPDHLWIGGVAENNADMGAKGRHWAQTQKAKRTHCARGHELVGNNFTVIQGGRRCLVCVRRRDNLRRPRAEVRVLVVLEYWARRSV